MWFIRISSLRVSKLPSILILFPSFFVLYPVLPFFDVLYHLRKVTSQLDDVVSHILAMMERHRSFINFYYVISSQHTKRHIYVDIPSGTWYHIFTNARLFLWLCNLSFQVWFLSALYHCAPVSHINLKRLMHATRGHLVIFHYILGRKIVVDKQHKDVWLYRDIANPIMW